MSENPTVESIVRRYLIRYTRLRQAIPYAFNSIPGNELNIYVDLFGLYRTIYSRSFCTNITDYVSFTSSIINLCAHYRAFFKSNGIWTKFFLISSFNCPDHIRQIIPEYNKTIIEKKQNKLISDMMDFNFKLLSILCPYLPDIFFLQTDHESSVLMYELMLRENKHSLIISTDTYPLQLCSLLDNTAYIWPRWIRDENRQTQDISPICPPRTHPEHKISFAYITQRKNGKVTSDKLEGAVIPSNYMLLEALNQFKERDLKILVNAKVATSVINNTPGGQEIALHPSDISQQLHDHKINESDPMFIELLNNRFNSLSVIYQYEIFRNSLEYSTLHYENLQDPDAINLINSKYFSKDPIDLLRLN